MYWVPRHWPFLRFCAGAWSTWACDTTHYGSSRSSPRTFYAHHAAAVSAAVQAHESLTLENAAASLARSLLANPSPLSRALVGVTAP